MTIEPSKLCTKCGVEKALAEFYKCKKNKSGYQATCKSCDSEKGKAYYKGNKDAVLTRTKANKSANPERTAEVNRAWHQANRERRQAEAAARRRSDPERHREYTRKSYRKNPQPARDRVRRRQQTPKGKLENTVRVGMLRGLKKGGKAGKKSFDALGYTSDQLMVHLESRFTAGMSWANHGHGVGCWHIDHIRPLASFSYETVNDPQFREAWALSNLQPLWAKENLAKSDTWSPPAAANDNMNLKDAA